MADSANIKVDYAKLSEKGKEMAAEANNMQEALEAIAKAILELKEAWDSSASTEMYNYIKKIKENTIPRYKSIVDEYAQFLDATAEKYIGVETELTQKTKELEFE